MRGIAGEKNLLKRLNRAAILRLVWQESGISSSAVASRIGITKSTVSQSVAELEALGWLERGDGSDNGAVMGRPSIPLCLASNNLALIGAEVRIGEINVVATDVYGGVLVHHQQRGQYQQVSSALDDLTSGIKTVLKSQELLKRNVLGVGVGVPGPVDPSQGLVLHAPNLGWKRIALHTMLLERLQKINLSVDNDANMAVFAEYMFGRFKQSADLLYLYIETGIGGGLILGHQLYRGRRGFAGEVGHMTVLPNGAKCSCGNQGCAETLFSTWVLLDQYKKETGKSISLEQLLHALETGDTIAKKIVQKAGMYLGIFLGSLANIFDPKLIIIGGSFGQLGGHILGPAEREIHKRLFGDEFREVQLEQCEFGSNASAIGAAGYIWHQLLQNAEELPVLSVINSRT